MIQWSFDTFDAYYGILDKAMTSYFENLLEKDINSAPDGSVSIDDIWALIEKLFQYQASSQEAEIIRAYKQETIMSIYISLFFFLEKGKPYSKIFNEYLQLTRDSGLSVEYDGERSNLEKYRIELHKLFQYEYNLSGQQIENNALLYFSQFWNSKYPSNIKRSIYRYDTLKVFNSYDFIYCAKKYNWWPYNPTNRYGMDFYSYLENLARPAFTDINRLPEKTPFQRELSCYILEQLFYPEHFICNVEKHLKETENLFNKVKEPRRERSIILARPLFQLPIPVWNILSEEYYTSMIKYINTPDSSDSKQLFMRQLESVAYFHGFLYPTLQCLLVKALYIVSKNDCFQIKAILEQYISSHIDHFSFFDSMSDCFKKTDQLKYPPLNNTNSQTPSQSDRRKLFTTLTSKRNNTSILSYEINFTYNFFVEPHSLNYYEWVLQRKMQPVNAYWCWYAEQYFNKESLITDSVSTDNYKRYSNGEATRNEVTLL